MPEEEPIRVRFDATTTKKTGRKIEGASTYRNGAGTARQEWRTLFGLSFVVGEMRIRLSNWPEGFVSVPIGLALYLKKQAARGLGRPYRSRSELAREMLDRLCRLVSPGRTVVSVQDGDYATKAFLRDLPVRTSREGSTFSCPVCRSDQLEAAGRRGAFRYQTTYNLVRVGRAGVFIDADRAGRNAEALLQRPVGGMLEWGVHVRSWACSMHRK